MKSCAECRCTFTELKSFDLCYQCVLIPEIYLKHREKREQSNRGYGAPGGYYDPNYKSSENPRHISMKEADIEIERFGDNITISINKKKRLNINVKINDSS